MHMTSIGEKIRARRIAAGMTLVQLQKLTGINNGNLSKIEWGKQGVTEASMSKIAHALGVSMAELLETHGDRLGKVDSSISRTTIPYEAFCTFKVLTDLPKGARVLIRTISVRDGHPSEQQKAARPNWTLAPEGQDLAFEADAIRHLKAAGDSLVAMVIKGDSMSPVFCDGEQVIIDTSDTAVPDAGGAFALAIGRELLVRRVFRIPGQSGYTLRCDNALIPSHEVHDAESITLIGRIKHRSGTRDF